MTPSRARRPLRRLLGGLALLACLSAVAADGVSLTPAPEPLARALPRIGLNLGGASTWGADQLPANVLKNPGFEAVLDRSLVIVKEVGRDGVTDDSDWLARPADFWGGAAFTVLSGAAAGRAGQVLESKRRGRDGPDRFLLDPMPLGLRPGDAIGVSATGVSAGVPLWWSNGGRLMSSIERRPGSPGRQSAHLIGGGGRVQLLHYLDTIGARAGKLLLVNGMWRLSFWARGGAGQALQVRFQRQGMPPFLRATVTLGREWRQHVFEWRADERPQAAPSGPLELALSIDAGEAWIDDAELGPARAGAGGFRPEVVALLRQLKPGYLRDWQGQLGDSVANRLAEPFARRPTRYRPGEHEMLYLYSLPDFLELCAAVGARPWVVAPTLADAAEYEALGRYLKQAAARHGFREIVLEFGNENWNILFRPAGMLNALTHAQAADRAFRAVKAGAAGFNGLLATVNAQFVNPDGVRQIARASAEASRVTVAPYFLYSLAATLTPDQAVAAAFADDDRLVRADRRQAQLHGKQLSVYEVNFHTTEGDAGLALRNRTVAGAHSGAALAKRLLETVAAGVREQAVYSLTGFDFLAARERGLVRMWGVARDLAPGRLRPTGLALQLLNEAVGGDVHAARCDGAAPACRALTALFFRDEGGTRLALASAAAEPTLVRTSLPCARPYQLRLLDGGDADANNETTERVALRAGAARCDGGWQFVLPAHSVAVLAERPPAPPPTRR